MKKSSSMNIHNWEIKYNSSNTPIYPVPVLFEQAHCIDVTYPPMLKGAIKGLYKGYKVHV